MKEVLPIYAFTTSGVSIQVATMRKSKIREAKPLNGYAVSGKELCLADWVLEIYSGARRCSSYPLKQFPIQ